MMRKLFTLLVTVVLLFAAQTVLAATKQVTAYFTAPETWSGKTPHAYVWYKLGETTRNISDAWNGDVCKEATVNGVSYWKWTKENATIPDGASVFIIFNDGIGDGSGNYNEGTTKTKDLPFYDNGIYNITGVVDNGIVKENPLAGRTYSEGFYLVGNFFDFSGSGITYDDAVFKFQQTSNDKDGNLVYMVEIPATLTAKAQVMGVNYKGQAVTVYGPGSVLDVNNTNPQADENHIGSISGNLTGSTTLAQGTNYWNMSTRRTQKYEGGQDGSYTYCITVDKTTKVPVNWEIKYTDLKRVAYYISTDKDATAFTLSVTRNDLTGNFDSGKMVGSVYVKGGSEFYGIANTTVNDQLSGNVFEGYSVIETDNNVLPTYPKLFLLGHDNDYLSKKTTNCSINNVFADCGTFKLDVAEGLSVWEFNFNNGNNDERKLHGNIGGQVQSRSDKIISSISMVGPAIPGTMKGDEWDWASSVADMTWNATENCYELKLSTSAEEGQKKFRFVGNHTQEINWYENSTNDEDKARVPYLDTTKPGHAANASDHNEVSYTEANAQKDNPDYDIIWNRPAGTWIVRFYKDFINESGNVKTYYHYSITESHTLELRDFGSIKYKGNERIIYNLNKTGYKYFRTWSDNKAWKRPKNVHVFVVADYQAASEENAAKFTLKNIDDFKQSSENGKDEYGVIPANTGVILAAGTDAENDGKKTDALTETSYNLLTINLEEASNNEWEYVKETNEKSLLTPLVSAANVPTKDETGYNYLFGFYNAHRLYPSKYDDTKLFLLGFWISNGNGTFYSNSAYMHIKNEEVDNLGIGVDYSFVTGQSNAKKIPALLFDFESDSAITGVKTIETVSANTNAKYYTLSGMQVEKPTKAGIYIHNGKKYIVK